MSGDVGEQAGPGGLAAVLCRLARDGFTGVVYAERDDDAGAVFSLLAGRVVFVEDLGDEQSIPDMLLERGLLDERQYAEIAADVVESLAENEDVAFCQQAVSKGILSQDQVDAELDRRVRGRIIQAVGWRSCRIELDPDPDTLLGIPEYPQQIAPLVHTGVRTFYDEERVRATLRHDGALYVRLTRSADELAELLSLDEVEAGLLRCLKPDAPVTTAFEECAAEPLDAWQLLCTLVIADLAETSSAPLSPAERSGVRSTQAMTGRHGLGGGVREERAGPGSQARMPAVGPDGRAAGSQGRIPAAVAEGALQHSQPRMPAAGPVERTAPPAAQAPPARAARVRGTGYSSATIQAIQAEQIKTAAAPSASSTARAPNARGQAAEAPRPQPAPEPEVTVRRSARPGRERRRPRKLSVALKRLDRELKQLRPPSSAATPAAPQPTETSAQAPAGMSAGKAHLEQLRRMRAAALSQRRAATPTGGERSVGETFRMAQEALRDQQFPRAHELMRKVCEHAPDDEVYSMFCMWAGFRAGALADDGVTKLRNALRMKVSDDEHKAFAYYALGHVSLHDKKDDAAEKFFRRAVELDKHNKDAERHLRIIELRRKTAAVNEKSNKIFGIEIKKKS